MTRIVTTLTVSLIALSWERLRRVVRGERAAGRLLVDDELNLARLQLPHGWRPAIDLNEGAVLQAIDPIYGRHVIVISEALDDYAPGVTVHDHARVTVDLLIRGIRVTRIGTPQHRVIRGLDAVQYEIEGLHDSTWVKYLHTTINGRRAFHQVIAWSAHSRYDRQTFDALLEGFDELPGPDPVRRSPPDPPAATDARSPFASCRVH